jgi:hypothetical protein
VDACITNSQTVSGLVSEGVRARVSERAARSHPHRRVPEVYSELEWLTMDELLDVCEANKWIGVRYKNFDGLVNGLRRELVPTRNNIVHFRTVSPADCDNVVRWLARVRRMIREQTS